MNILSIKPYATIIIILVTVGVFIVQTQSEYISIVYGLNAYFLQGFYWQPLSTMFIHANLMHLAMNMVVLFQFGALIEHVRGRWIFIVLYIGGGVATSILTFVFISVMDWNVNVVGASGAICALFGWIAQKDTFNRKGLIIAILLISFLPLLIGMRIAWYAHLIGFGVGWVFAKTTK